ncbi:MAG: NTE family protein [Neolewinella sp.]|jgi:NTE family protein
MPEDQSVGPDNFTIGLALSGGGARGLAHIGVLRALLENDIVPNRLVGVSAGAIVAMLYAAGLSPDEMMAAVYDTNPLRLIKVGLPTTGLTTLEYLEKQVRKFVPDNSFEALKYPLHVGITNLNSGMQELRHSGPLDKIIAASCSLPLMFKPVVIDGDHYVDGGVINNMPVAPLLNDADFIIGSNLMPYGSLPPADTGTVINIVWRCFDLSIMANSQSEVSLCDIVLETSLLNSYTIFSVNKLKEMHNVGYQDTINRMPEIMKSLEQKRELLAELGRNNSSAQE